MNGDMPVDVASRALVDLRYSILITLELTGPCDHAALAAASTARLTDEPVYRSTLVDSVGPFRRRPVWRPGPIPPVDVVDLSSLGDVAIDDPALVEEIFDRRPVEDLRRRPPTRITIGRLDGRRTVLALEVHHAHGDAARNYGFLRSILSGYHSAVTGSAPAWADGDTLHSVSGAANVEPAGRADLLRWMADFDRRYPTSQLTHVTGTSTAGSPRQTGARFVVDADTARSLRRRARSAGASLGDLVLAATMSAVATWNADRGTDPGVQRAEVVVGQHGRAPDTAPNEISGIVIGARPDDLEDLTRLLESVAVQRRAAMDAGIDVRLAVVARRLRRLAEMGPLFEHLGRTAVARRPPCTFHFSNAGVIWPRVVDGRPTGGSVVGPVGDLEITDMSFLGNVRDDPRIWVSLLTFEHRLMIGVAASTVTLSEEETCRLAELVGARVVAYDAVS